MKIVVGITGSSGAVYALDYLKTSKADKFLIVSKWGKALLKDELNMSDEELHPYVKRHFADTDLSAPVASGSNRYDAFVILPCSTSTLGKIASGIGDSLITRAAQVALKERFKLILCIRETPLSTVTLEQCAKLSGYGVTIMPISPPLYFTPKSANDYISAFTDKLMGVTGERVSRGWRAEEFE